MKWSCIFSLSLPADETNDPSGQLISCQNRVYESTGPDWVAHNVVHKSADSFIWWRGYWEVFLDGRRGDEGFAQTVGRQFWYILGVRCTFQNSYQPDVNCANMGSFTATALRGPNKPKKLPWVVHASSAIKNINQQLVSTRQEVKDAGESLALDAFSIDDFYPKPDQDFDIQDGLAGLGGIFTVLGGFIPVAGQTLEVVGTIASGVGTFLANSAKTNPLNAQKGLLSKSRALLRKPP